MKNRAGVPIWQALVKTFSAVLLAGLLLSAKKRYLTSNLAILFTSVPYMMTICIFIGWHGGWSPPVRYMVVLLPVWSFYLACVLQQVNGYFTFLLSIAMQVMVTSPALAAGGKGGGGAPFDPNGYVLYTSGLCQSWTHEEVPQEWKDAGLCDASVGQSFAQPGNGNCQQGCLAEMTQTGQQECVLTVVSIRSECPVGFALDGGRCDYEPVGRIGWEVGFCQSFTTGQVPPEWITDHICDINPVPDPQQTFVQPLGSGPCQQDWIKTMTRAGLQECVLAVPTFKSECPIGFALQMMPSNWPIFFFGSLGIFFFLKSFPLLSLLSMVTCLVLLFVGDALVSCATHLAFAARFAVSGVTSCLAHQASVHAHQASGRAQSASP